MAGFTIEGLDKLIKDLERAVGRVPQAKKQFLLKEAALLRSRAMNNTPVDTGLLRGSWQQVVLGNSIDVFNTAHYAPYVEYGHRVKIHGRFTGTFVPGRYMLKKAMAETRANFAQDSKAILRQIFRG